jgi:hypothetical protein
MIIVRFVRWLFRWTPALGIAALAGWLAVDTLRTRGLAGESATIFGPLPAPIEALAWAGLATAVLALAVRDLRKRLRTGLPALSDEERVPARRGR